MTATNVGQKAVLSAWVIRDWLPVCHDG